MKREFVSVLVVGLSKCPVPLYYLARAMSHCSYPLDGLPFTEPGGGLVARAFEKDGTELGSGMGLWRALLVLASFADKGIASPSPGSPSLLRRSVEKLQQA
jgi:hypothetical protein